MPFDLTHTIHTLRLPLRIIIAGTLVCTFLLFTPERTLNSFGILDFKRNWRTWILLGFVWSSIIIVNFSAYAGKRLISVNNHLIRERKFRSRLDAFDDEKKTLRLFGRKEA